METLLQPHIVAMPFAAFAAVVVIRLHASAPLRDVREALYFYLAATFGYVTIAVALLAAETAWQAWALSVGAYAAFVLMLYGLYSVIRIQIREFREFRDAKKGRNSALVE